jgi:hypothetical protein
LALAAAAFHWEFQINCSSEKRPVNRPSLIAPLIRGNAQRLFQEILKVLRPDGT